MGIGHFKSESAYNSLKEENQSLREKLAVNPNPKEFEILEVFTDDSYTVLKIKYPNCTNAEGIKILVYKATPVELLKRKEFDPHFGHKDSPIARFEPTDQGWNMAIKLATSLALSESVKHG